MNGESNILTTNLRIEELELGVFSPRKHFSPAYIEELAESIQNEGQLKPIIVRLHPTQPNKYQVIDGEHRVRALKKLGRTLVRAEIRKLSDEEADFLAMKVNLMHGKRLNELEEALHIEHMIKSYGYTQQQIAKAFNKSQAWVSNRLSLATALAPETKNNVISRLITSSHAIEIAELPKEDQPLVAKKVAQERLSRRATRALVHAFKKAETPEKKQQILSQRIDVAAQIWKQPQALERALLTEPEQPEFQRVECPRCGNSAWIDWNARTLSWEEQ
jgi:ParB family chromosome partitioning protein